MSFVLELLREAWMDLEEATEYYERQQPGLGARFRAEVESVCEAVLRSPRRWAERDGGYRRVNLAKFPYYLAYFIRKDRILVAAVGHASRDPDYWKWRDFRDRPEQS